MHGEALELALDHLRGGSSGSKGKPVTNAQALPGGRPGDESVLQTRPGGRQAVPKAGQQLQPDVLWVRRDGREVRSGTRKVWTVRRG